MFALRDKTHAIVAINALFLQNPLKWGTGWGVHNEQFMLIELNLHLQLGMHNGDTCATVVEEQIFEVPEDTF